MKMSTNTMHYPALFIKYLLLPRISIPFTRWSAIQGDTGIQPPVQIRRDGFHSDPYISIKNIAMLW